LRCVQAKKKKASRLRSAFVNFMLKREAERQAAGELLRGAEYKEWRRLRKQDFEELSPRSKQVEIDEARAAHAAKLVELEGASSGGGDDLPRLGETAAMATIVQKIGDVRTPFVARKFEECIRRKLGLSSEDKTPGFTRYCDTYRKQQREAIFVKDSGDIAADEKFLYYVPCGLAHPGLCATKHAWCIEDAKRCADQLYKVVGELRGDFIHLRFIAGDWHKCAWAAVSHRRGSAPRMLMLACCSLDEASRRLSIDDTTEGYFDFMMAVSLVGYFQDAPRGQSISVYWALAPVNEAKTFDSAAQVELHENWKEQLAIVPDSQRVHFP